MKTMISTHDARRMVNARRLAELALCLFCVIAIPLGAYGQDPHSSAREQMFQAAMIAEDKGDLESAKRLLVELRRESPDVFAINESLGLIDVAQGRINEALPLLRAAVQEQPASEVAHVNLGGALFKVHRNDQAIHEFEEAARLNPESEIAQQSLGELWLDAGKPDRAIEAFSAALLLKPSNDDLTISYAAALVAGKRYQDAARALASTANPGQSGLAQSLLGEIDEQGGSFETAAQHFARAVELDPSEENVWALGVEFLRHWTFEAAVKEFEAGRERFPSSMRMRFGLGAAYFGDAKYTQAIPVFASLLDIDSDNAVYAELLGMTCNAVTESTKPQCSSLLAYAHAHPRDFKASTYAASMLLTETASGPRMDEARTLLKNALAAGPNFANAHYQMGLLMQESGDWPGSLPSLETAVRLKPDLAQAHYRLALAYWRVGRKEEAEAQMALQKKWAQEERQDLDHRLQQITTFLVDIERQ